MQKYKILVVDDELDIQRLIVELLSDEGYTVEGVDTGEGALKKVKEFNPHLVVLDWQLPDMEGVDVLRILKSDTTTAHIPVIMCTSLGSQDHKIKGLETGADDYVTKPFNSAELLTRVKVALRRIQQEEKIIESKIAQLQKFIPKEMIEKLFSGPKIAEGERRIVTVLFADLTGFTAMAEEMDPEEVKKIVDECFKELVDAIKIYNGTIDKFIGDAIMALFGAPVTHKDDPQRAVKAALVMLYKLNEFNKTHPELKKKLQMRIGIHTGEVVAGTVGSDTKMEFTVMGDTVNTASRIQSVASPNHVVVSEDTQKYVKDEFVLIEQPPVTVKGKKEPLKIYSVQGSKFLRYNFIKINNNITPYVVPQREYNFVKNFVDKILSSSTGYCVSVVGEYGIGKSRLLYELSKYIEQKKIKYYEFKCLPYGQQGATLIVYDPINNKFVPSGIKQIIIENLNTSPVILLVDDVHNLNDVLNTFLSSIISLAKNKPLLTITTSLPGSMFLWKDNSFYREIGLVEEVKKSEYAKKILDCLLNTDDTEIEQIKNLILQKSENIPVVIESFVEDLIDKKIISYDEKKMVRCNTKIYSLDNIPTRVYCGIMAQVDQFDVKTKEVLQIASAIGKEFKYKLLKQLYTDENVVKDAINKLLQKKFVIEKSLLPERIYEFRLNLFYEVVSTTLLQSVKKELQDKITSLKS